MHAPIATSTVQSCTQRSSVTWSAQPDSVAHLCAHAVRAGGGAAHMPSTNRIKLFMPTS